MASHSARPNRSTSAITRGELISAVSALLLLVLMFVFAWYGVDGIPGRTNPPSAVVSAENAWNGLTAVRWLMLLTVTLAFAAPAVHARRPSRRTVAALRFALLLVATLTAALLVFRVLIIPPSSNRVVDQKLGAVLGLIASLGIAYGAYESVREQRMRRSPAR